MSSSSEHETKRDQIISQVRCVYQHAKVLSLATLDENGETYSTPVYFCHGDALDMYFFSDATTQHSIHVLKHAQISVSIYKEQHSVEDLAGIQLKGICSQVEEPQERDEIEQWYIEKFPFIAEKEMLLKRLKQHCVFKIQPTWLKLTDNSVQFGYKAELEL